MPLPLQLPPLRPDWTRPLTPVYAEPFQLPSDAGVISRLSWRSSRPATLRLSTRSVLFPPAVSVALPSVDAIFSDAGGAELPKAKLPRPTMGPAQSYSS